MKKLAKIFSLLTGALLISDSLFAHTINYALEKAPVHEVVGYYLKLGFQHIILLRQLLLNQS